MEESCPECGHTTTVCPECGSRSFSTHIADDAPGGVPMDLAEFVEGASDGATLTVTDACWECDFVQTKEITVEHV